MRTLLRSVYPLALVFVCAAQVYAAITSTISGVVAAGAAIPGATLAASRHRRQISRSSFSRRDAERDFTWGRVHTPRPWPMLLEVSNTSQLRLAMIFSRLRFQTNLGEVMKGRVSKTRPANTCLSCKMNAVVMGYCFTAIAEISIFAPPIKPAT